MSTLSERLAKHIEPCETMAASFPALPPLIAVPLLNGPSPNEFVTLRLPTTSHEIPVAFADDGTVTGKGALPRGIEFLGQSVVTCSGNTGKRSFGILVINKVGVHKCRENWQQWKSLAGSIAPLLWSFPETGLASLSHPASAVLAFIFQRVYGTSFLQQHENHWCIANLWAATLSALRSPVLSETNEARPAVKSRKGIGGRKPIHEDHDERERRFALLLRVVRYNSHADAAEAIALKDHREQTNVYEEIDQYLEWLRKSPTAAKLFAEELRRKSVKPRFKVPGISPKNS